MPTTHRLIQLESISSNTWLVHPANTPQERLLLRWHPCPQTVVPIHTGLGCWISQGLVDSKVASIERISAVVSLRECTPPEHVQGNIYAHIKNILNFLHQYEVSHGKIDPDEIWFKCDGSVMLTGTALIKSTVENDHIQLEQLWEELNLSKAESGSSKNWAPQRTRHSQSEFLYERLTMAPRHDVDLPLIQEYSESTAPQLLLFEEESEEHSQTAKLNILSTMPLVNDITSNTPLFERYLKLPPLILPEPPALEQEEENTQNSTRPLIEEHPFSFKPSSVSTRTQPSKEKIGADLIIAAAAALGALLYWCFSVLTG